MKSSSRLCLGLAALFGCGKPPPEDERKLVGDTLLELDLTEAPVEHDQTLLGASRPSHYEGLLRVRELVGDPLARGLFVRLGPFGGQFADVDDWAETLESYRTAKKPVHCHFDGLDNAGYALAAHCDQISMTPAGMLELVGLALQAVHGRALLDSLGVKADVLQVGKYKGAAESFTRESMSDAQRESSTLADRSRPRLSCTPRAARARPAALQKLLDAGPYTADAARAAGSSTRSPSTTKRAPGPKRPQARVSCSARSRPRRATRSRSPSSCGC